ncbi:type II secretion system protein [Candidatus Parcubacteria bacterium]|nr:type II secretion system protein [Candidatus Parcubacteria bacterium]
MKNNKKGFTLIELLVVIAIIGLLSTLAVVALNNARQKSRDAKRVADIKQVQTALELFFNDQQGYPNSAAAALPLGVSSQSCLGAGGFGAAGACTNPVYMAQVPSYPEPFTDNTCTAATSGYTYTTLNPATGLPSTYRISYCLGADTGGVDVGVNIACEGGIAGCTAP